MDSVFLFIALTFQSDFNVKLPPLRFERGHYEYHGKAENKVDHWIIQIDEDHPPKALKTIVYHELGHIIGLSDSNKRDFMNPDFTTYRYSRKLIPKE